MQGAQEGLQGKRARSLGGVQGDIQNVCAYGAAGPAETHTSRYMLPPPTSSHSFCSMLTGTGMSAGSTHSAL